MSVHLTLSSLELRPFRVSLFDQCLINVRLLLGGILEVGPKAVLITVEPLRLVLEFLGRRLLQNFRLNGNP